MEHQTTSIKNNNLAIPIAIVAAGALIAGAVYFSGMNTNGTGRSGTQSETSPSAFGSGGVENIKPIATSDHILGNPRASVKVVEFSDTECPFCKSFHPTMHRLIEEYGEGGEVAWVYRHFPLDQIHSKARREMAALELANELGGNEKFWAYLDRLFEVTPSNDNLQLSQLVQIARDVGLPAEPFQKLLDENDTRGGKYANHIEENYQDAVTSGGNGTPYTVVIAPNGQKFPVSGAQPYEAVRQVVEAALKLK